MITQQEYQEIVEFVEAYLDGKKIFKDDNLFRILKNAKLLEERLMDNIRAGNFDTYYQPKFVNSAYTTSAEALFRSRDSFHVRPDVAFTLFKLFGHEKEVVLKQIEKITDDLVLFIKYIDKDFKVSINVAIACIDKELVDTINTMIMQKNLNFKNLGIELLESENFKEIQGHRDVISYLHEKGVIFAIDDFGVRNADFEALKQLPFDVIKIDSSYLKKAHISNDYSEIVKLERKLKELYPGAKIVVEGVEEKQDFERLSEIGIPQVYQGYYFAKPMTAKEIVEKYRKRNTTSSTDDEPNGALPV